VLLGHVRNTLSLSASQPLSLSASQVAGDHTAPRLVRGNPVLKREESPQPVELLLPPQRDTNPVVSPAADRAQPSAAVPAADSRNWPGAVADLQGCQTPPLISVCRTVAGCILFVESREWDAAVFKGRASITEMD
jgi:hypothetical protein